MKITFLLGEKQRKHSAVFYLANLPCSGCTLFSAAENSNCCVRAREAPDSPHTGTLRGEGRLPPVWKEPHHNWRDASESSRQRKIPQMLARLHCDASPAGNPTAPGSQASLPAPTQSYPRKRRSHLQDPTPGSPPRGT